MTAGRYSTPPDAAKLEEATRQLEQSNDRLEMRLGLTPKVELTDAQRLAVVHEIHAEMRGAGGSTVVALERYEDKIRGRAGK